MEKSEAGQESTEQQQLQQLQQMQVQKLLQHLQLQLEQQLKLNPGEKLGKVSVQTKNLACEYDDDGVRVWVTRFRKNGTVVLDYTSSDPNIFRVENVTQKKIDE